ncbi:MAG: Arm DNA-binding domain-containing protein, partial [Hyphomonas sp.]
MPLTDLKIRSLKPEDKPRRYTDGGNLFVEVRPNGSKLWRYAYKFDGKQKLMALGPYPDISLAKAREKRTEARALLLDGIDPMLQAKVDKLEQKALTEDTFSALAAELLDKNRREGLAETTLSKKAWLIGIANADLADLPV